MADMVLGYDLCSYGLYGYGLYSYGVYCCGLYSYDRHLSQCRAYVVMTYIVMVRMHV